ncbi:MAG TPA: hypothetical protein VK846_11235, partial [Candidatus Limnocylindria bacterium]|nr:hypothetical protein [Candidatus Limnocylindria bacterium]
MAAVALCAGLWIVLHLGGHRIAHENGLMENQQALCLALAALAFLAAARRQSARPDKLFCISLTLFCFTFLSRELQIRGERVPDWLESMLRSWRRHILLSVCWGGVLIAARNCWRKMLSTFARWVRTPAGL